MSDNQYNPVACEHKLPNGFSAWSFQSEEQSNLGGQNKVSIHVCMLCGEISIGGYRPSKDEKHTNSFHETFHICHPDAIDAIIKQANYYNEGAKWGRVNPSENGGGAVWVKASKRIPEGHAADYHWRFAHSKKPIGCVFHIALGTLVMEYGNTRARYNFSDVEWLDESGVGAQPEKQLSWGPDEYPDLSSCTDEQKYETIAGLVQVTAKEVMRMFYAFGLKTHIECTVVNDLTNETFDFIFRKKEVAAGSGKEETVTMNQRIAQQILKVRDAIVDGDVDLAYHELYKIASPNFDKMSDEVWADIEKAASHPTIEIDLAAAMEEGAELWKMEYDSCRNLLQELVALKDIKETEGKTEDYLIRQPIAWKIAKKFLEKYQHISW